MKQVFKFPARQRNIVPRCTKPIAVKEQDGVLMVWAEVNHNMKYDATMTVTVVPTGGDVPAGFTYIETVLEGPFVWHYYVKIAPH